MKIGTKGSKYRSLAQWLPNNQPVQKSEKNAFCTFGDFGDIGYIFGEKIEIAVDIFGKKIECHILYSSIEQ